MNRRLFELFPLLLVVLSGALSAQSMDQQEFREIFDPYLGVWSGEYRIFSQQDELLNSFKVERRYWWEQHIMMEQVTYDFGDMQQTYFNRIVLSEGMPFAFVTDSPESEKIRSALRGSNLKGTLIWTRVLPKGSLPVRISERIVKKGEEMFIDFWGDQEAINNRGESMFVRIEGYLVYQPGSRDYQAPTPEPEIPEPAMIPDEPEPIVEPEPVVEQKPEIEPEPEEEPAMDIEPEPEPVEAMVPPAPEESPPTEPLEPEPQEEAFIPEPQEEDPTPEPIIEEPAVEPEPVGLPAEIEVQEEPETINEQETSEIIEVQQEPDVIEVPEPVVEEELPPPPPPPPAPMPSPAIRSALENMNVVGIRDEKGDECIVVDYMLLYRLGDRLDMAERCYFTGIDSTQLYFKDANNFEYSIPRKDKE